MNEILYVKNLNLTFQLKHLLKNIQCQISQGEVVALLGLNGAGKSTFLKVLLHLVPGAQGTIRINQIPNVNPKSRALVAYLPEKFIIHPVLTGRAYLAIMLDGHMDRVSAVANAIDFPLEKLDNPVKTYSKGTLQKLGLLYFFAAHKSFKIADEIMSGLDFKTRKQVQQLLRLQSKQGITFLFSTHMLEDAQAIATRVLYIEQGALAFDGPVDDTFTTFAEHSL